MSQKQEMVQMICRPTASYQDVWSKGADIASVPGVNPFNHDIFRSRRKIFDENRLDFSKPEDADKLRKKIIASLRDNGAAAELAAYREFVLEASIMAMPFTMAAFQQVNLSADELPMMVFPRPKNLQRFTVRSASITGESRFDQWREQKSISTIEMEFLKSDKVEYPLMDLQQGNISQEAAVKETLGDDMEMKMDALGLVNIDAAKTTSGLRALISIHPSVNTANVPDTNYLDLTALNYGPANKLTLPRLKAILKHVRLFSAADPKRAIRPTSMVMSPLHEEDVWEFTDLVTGWNDASLNASPVNAVPTAVREEIFRTGAFTQAYGSTFAWQPNSQLAVGRMYIFTDQPLGWTFTKSEFDQVIQWNASNSPKHADYNYGEVQYQKAVRFYVPDLWKHHIVIVDF